MISGKLRHRITAERQVTTKDAAGQINDTWTVLFTRMADLEPVSGREYFNASGERAEITTQIRVRYDAATASLKPYDRILHGSTAYDVMSVINVRERNRELLIMAKRAA